MKSLLVLLSLFISISSFGQDLSYFSTFDEIAKKAQLKFITSDKVTYEPISNLLEITLENGSKIPAKDIQDFTFTSDRKIDRLDLSRDRVIYGEEIKYGTILDLYKKQIIVPVDKLKIPHLDRHGKHEGGESGGGG